MKKLLQRWLAMVLAVLMVMGTLPTSAWAARVTDDEARENPVLDQNDPVADTQGRYDDEEKGEKPTDPIDPDGPPADLTAAIKGVTAANKTVTTLTGTIATGVGEGEDPLAVLIVPRFVTVSGDGSPTTDHELLDGGDFRTFFNNNASDAAKKLEDYAGMPYVWLKSAGTTINNVSVDWEWKMYSSGVEVTTAQHSISEDVVLNNMQSLSDYVDRVGDNFYEPLATTTFDPRVDGLPFTIFMAGSSGVQHDTFRIKVGGSPLSVTIETPELHVKDDGNGGFKTTNRSMTLEGEQENRYTFIYVKNLTGETMNNVTVTLNRSGFVSALPSDNWLKTVSDAEDKSEDSIFTPPAGYEAAEDVIVGHAYGFDGETSPWGTFTITTLEPYNAALGEGMDEGAEKEQACHAAVIPLITPKDTQLPGYAGDKAGSYDSLKMKGVLFAFYGFDADENELDVPDDAYSVYTVTATNTKGDGTKDTASANGGIHWALNLAVTAQVQLVYGEHILASEEERTGTKYQFSGNGANGTAQHRVTVGKNLTVSKELTWDATGQYYTGAAEQGDNVYVDGVDVKKKLGPDGTTVQVPTYKVTLKTDPEDKFSSTDKVGNYIWRNDITSKVNFTYYPVNATVGVFAQHAGSFTKWSGVTNDTPQEVSGNKLEPNNTSNPNGNMGARVTLTKDAEVTAHYAKPITLATTIGGGNPGTTGFGGDAGNRNTQYVWSVEFRRTGGDSLTATRTAGNNAGSDSDFTFSSTKLTMNGGVWSAELDAGVTYTLYVNGVQVAAPFTSATAPTAQYNGADTDFNFVAELAGVTPKVAGTTETGSTMVLPYDQNPNTDSAWISGNNIVVTGAKPNTDGALTLYYPVVADLTPTWARGLLPNGDESGFDRATKLTYGGVEKALDAEEAWSAASKFAVESGGSSAPYAKELVVTFAEYPEIWIYLDGTQQTGTQIAAKDIVLRPTEVADDSADITVTQDTTNKFRYTSNAALDGTKTYHVWVNGFDTNLTVADKKTGTIGGDSYTYIPVPLQQVTVADQTLTGATRTKDSSFTGGMYTTATKTGYIPNGCTISVVHGTVTNYAENGWILAHGTESEKGDFTYTASATDGSTASQGAQTLTAQYVASTRLATVKIYLDGDGTDDAKLSKAPVTTADGVQIEKDGTKTTLTKPATGTDSKDGIYQATVSPGVYNIYVNGKATGKTIDLSTAAATAKVVYWTVSVSTDGNGKATMTPAENSGDSSAVTATGTTAQTAVVQDGTKVTWAFGNPNTNYKVKGWDGTTTSTSFTGITINSAATRSHVANFQKKLAPLTITVRKGDDHANFEGYGKDVKLTKSDTSATTQPVTLTKDNAYTFSHTGLEAGVTYYIWAQKDANATSDDYKMVESFTVPDSEDAISKDVIYYTLTVAADTSIDGGATAGVAYGSTAPTDGTNTSVVVLSGVNATVKAFPSDTAKFSWRKWESSDKDTLAAPDAQSKTVTTAEADITLTAYFQRDKYDTYLQIKLNGDVLASADVGTGKDVTGAPTLGSYTVSYDTDKKAWKATVPVSDTTTKWSVGAVTSQSFSKAMVNGTDGSVQTLELFSLSLSVASGSTGLGTVSPADKMVYEKDTDVSIAATPKNTDYQWTSWTVAKGDNPGAATKTFAITKETVLEANFAKKTGTVTVKVVLDNTTNVNDATVTLDSATPASVANGVYTFNNIEYNEHGGTHTLVVSKTGWVGSNSQTVVVKQATTPATQVNFYTVGVATNAKGSATMKVGTEDPVPASNATAVTKVAEASTTVVWTVGMPISTSYTFSYWDNATTGSKQNTITATSLSAPVTHTANFVQDKFNAQLELKLNDNFVSGFDTDILSITLKRKTGTKAFTTVTLTAANNYDGTNHVWYVNQVPTENTYEWTVTTLGNKTFTATTGNGATDPDKQSISLYSLTTSVAAASNGMGTATPGRTIYKSGESVTVTATPSTNYKFVDWTNTKGDKPTTASATFNIAKETVLAANFARKVSDVTVTILLDDEADSYTGDTVPYHATLANSSITGTQGTGGNKHVYTFKDVPHNEGGTAYTLTVTRDGYYGTYTQANITVKDGSTNDFTVNYYTAKAKTAGANAAAARGDAKLSAGSGDSTVTATTDYKNTTTPTIEASIVVLSGTSVTWEAYNPADNYSFAYWDGTSGEKNATHAWTVSAKGVEHTAFFTKNAYNTYLDLTVNGEKWGTKGASDENIKNVQLVTAINGTTPVADVTVEYNETGKLWEAKGIASNTTNAQPYWRVTTVDDGVYYTKASIADKTTDATVAAATVTETLFGIAIEDGAGNGTGNKPTLKAQAASTAAARIVTRANTTATVALNKKSGYTFSDWAMKKGLAPAVGDTDATDMGDGNATGYTLATNYAAPTTAPTDGDLDLHIMPVYTYEVMVHTKHGEDLVATTVTAKENGGTSTGTITKIDDGQYKVSGLIPDKDYSITVNDFESDVDISEDDIGTPVVVKMYLITVDKAYHKPSGGTPNGTVQVQVKADAYAKNSRYLPQGASTDATNTANVKAAAGTNERLTHSVTYATEGDVALWSMAPTDKGVSIATGDINNANPAVAVANLSGDVTITAHFVLQYNVTVGVSNGTATTPTSTAAFTEKQSSASTIKDPATGALVDATTYVKAKFTKGTGETLTGWTISADGGTLYSDADLAEGHKIADPSTHTGEEVYFVPAKEGATLTANVEAATYEVAVTVKKDNGVYSGRKVYLKKTNTAAATADYTLDEEGSTGVYKKKILPGTYYIWVDGVTANDPKYTQKTIEFEAKHAEPDDPAYDATRLAKEVNYYTILLKADPTGDAGKRNKVEFNAINATSDHEAEMIFLATADGEDVTVAAAAQFDAAVSPRYRFDDWTQTKPADTVTSTFTETANKGIEKYALLGENALKAQKDGDFVIKPDNQITLTASFKQQFIVKVAQGNHAGESGGNGYNPWISADGNEPWRTPDGSITVDEGGSVKINATTSSGSAHENFVFKDWTIRDESETSKHGSFAAGSKALVGYIKPGATEEDGTTLKYNEFWPTADTVLELNLWKKADLKAGWVYDPVKKTGTDGEAQVKTVRWTKNDGKATPKSIALHKQNGTNWDEVTLNASDLTLKSGSQTEYVFADDYINALKNGTYRVTFTYEWADPDGAHTNKEDQTATTTFVIMATKLKLEEVNVGVRTDPDDDTKWAATANKNESTRDEVWYKAPHKQADIDEEELVFTWYYANEKPDPKAYSDIAGGKTSLEQAQEVVGALAGRTEITTVRAWPKADAAEIDTGIAQIDSISGIEGKYVFAIVTIKDGSERAEGTVITNAIPVDYDATITVNEDGDPVDETEAAGYAVYLWPTDGGAFDLNKEVDGKKVAIPTTYNKTSKKFETEDSPLIGEKTYHVYVREVEGKDEQYIQHKNGSSAVVISRTNTTDTVDYYTVTLTDLGKKSWANATSTTHPYLEHFKDSGNKEVGEAWDYANMPAVKAETSVNHVEVLSGKAVLKTTAVKATAKALTSEGNTDKAWLQDYNLDWYTDMTTAGTLAVTANIDQTNKTAITAGHTTAGITHATEITGKLKQNTYVIKGDVKDLTSGAKTGQIESDVTPAANKPVPTLTYTVDDSTSYVFKATGVTVNGGNGATVTFKVPRSSVGENKGAIVGTYFLEATPKSNPATTLKGYSVPTATEVPDPWTRNVDVAAGTTGAALNDRFTIFIESTSLTLEVKDEEKDTTHVHQRSGNTADTAATFNETTGRHNDTWTYNSKTASYTKQVIITNKGNTLLKVTPALEKYTKNASGAWVKDASFSYTPADNAFEDNLGNNKMTSDPKKIGFSNWKTSYDLAANGGEEAIPVTIPANLENSDDVRYRFIFTSEDGRDGYTGTGPTLWFELETVVEPVEVTKVTTEHPDGDIMKYRVKTTTIAEDEGKTGTPNYDALQKPQDSSGLTSGAPKADNDLVYEWYVADWQDHSKITLNTDEGKLYKNGVEMTPVTLGVSADTLTFDLNENPAAQGKTLYLLAKGKYNAKGAATTPDVTNKVDPPMQMPYTGKIYIEEDTGNKITAATGYTVYLWNKEDGPFDITSDKKIKATWVAPADGNPGYFAADDLYAADPSATKAYTYEVWTNKVKGTTDDAAANFQNSNQVVTGAVPTATVVYHSVTLNNTTVDNAPYDANFTVNSDLFFRYVDGTSVTKIYDDSATDAQKQLNAPTAKAGAIDVATSETNKWVQTGTSVTATYPAWTKDYALTWDSDATAVNTPTTAATKTYTVNDETEVDTQLKLNIYDVVANVNGTTGKVAYFTMVLTDGEQTYTFTSKTDSPDGDAILGVDTTVSEIVAGGEVVFKLPAAGPYVTKVKMPADTAAKLISYTNTDNSETEVTEGQEETTTIDVVVPVGGAEYAANLQGDGVSISFADNIPAATTIDGVNLETSGAKSQNGNAGITPKEGGVEISKKEAVQTIHLNYNSYTSAIPVEISFTNKSKYDSSGANDLKEVTFTKNGTTTAKPGGGDSITIDASSDLSATGIDMVSNADAAHPEVKKVVLNIQPGLHVGTTYTFKADVAFKDNKTPQNAATTSYTLNVIIDPLPITSLTIDKADNGDLKLTDYNATTAPNGGVFVDDDNNAATPAVPMSTVNFQAGDVSYVWAKAPVNISVDKNSFAMTTGATNTITATADDVTVTSETGTTLSAANIEPGVNYYLIAYSAKNTSNAADFAVSPAFKTTYPGIVYLNINGDLKQGKDDADSADGTDGGAYKVVFVNNDNNTVVEGSVTWKDIGGGKYAYSQDLNPNTAGYTAKISRAKGDLADAHLIALDKTIKGEPTIGTAATDANVVVANFFTVNPVAFIAKPYQTGTGEKFDYAAGTDGKSTTNTDIEPKFAIGTGADKADLADATPTVLSGQTITATAPKMDAPNDDKAWTQDYLLTWQADDATGADDTFVDANDKTPKNVSADNAVKAAGAYSQTITAKTYIGGRLDQKTYTVVGTVKGTGGYVGQVDMAFKPATGDTRSFTLTTGTAGSGKINDSYTLEDKDGDGIHGEPNDTVTFKVVKGAYEITAFDGVATGAGDTPANAPASTVLKVTVGADPNELDDVADRSKETLGGNAPTNPDVTANGRVFTMYVAGTDLELGVDDDDSANPATSTAPAISAGSGNVATNNKHADNVKTYYFNSTSTTPINLTLSNPGNADLKVKAEVFRFGPTDTMPDYATGSWTGGAALDKDHTYKDNATGSVVTIASTTTWPTTGETVAVGAGVADSGVGAVNAGSITLVKNAPNSGDATYIVRFTSTYVDNNSATPMTGPTVYYVFDLTVEPLPIVRVSATPDANGTMRLENFVSSTEATAEKPENKGLNSVLVDHDGDGKTAATGGTDPMGAELAGLVDDDISYAWYTAPLFAADGTTPVTVDKNDFQFNSTSGALELTTAGAAKGLTIGAATPGNGGKTYKPTDAEQGRNVYLVAYRASTACNASDLAVSEALYAQVTIKLEARRTNNVNAPNTASPLLTAVQIEGTYSEQTAHSNTNGANPGIVVNDRDNRVIAFTGDMNDYLNGKPDGTEDKPNDAKWYFVGWDDSDGKTPSGNVGAFTNKTDYTGTEYTVAAQATVIGYYDKLPELTGKGTGTASQGYSTEDTASKPDVPDNRTFVYDPYDGGGDAKVEVWIVPQEGSEFRTEDGNGSKTAPRQLSFVQFDLIAGNAPDPEHSANITFGKAGSYQLKRGWIKDNLNEDLKNKYDIIFYDLQEGSKANGYEGYDRVIHFNVIGGEKTVNARVKNYDATDATKAEHGKVTIRKKVDDTPSAAAQFVSSETSGGGVVVNAIPDAGYVFNGWTVITTDGGFFDSDAATVAENAFHATKDVVTVEASFRKANLTKEDGYAKIYYGTQRFVGDTETVTNYKNLTVGTSDTGAATNYTYTWLTGADLKTYLTKATADGGLGMSEADADVLVAKTERARYKTVEGETSGWLAWHDADVADNENKFVLKAAAKGVNVEKKTEDGALKDVGNELVVYVKATEQNSEQDLIVSFTIDIMTSELKIRTDGTGENHTQNDTQKEADGLAYKTKYVGVYGTDGTDPDEAKVDGTATDGKIIHGNAVEREWFEFISIDNVSDEDKLDHLIEALTDGNKNNAGGATDENGFTYVVTDKGVWKPVVPPTFNGAGSADENEIEYTFEFHYTGAEGVEDDYNYSDASIKIKIPVQRPQRDLLIADEVTDYTDLKRGDTYSDIEAPLPDDGVTTPTKLLAGHDTKRLGESITYLDEEPVYTAKLQRIGAFDEGTIKLELDPEENKTAVGFVLVDNNGNEIALNNATALKALLDAAAAELDEDGTEATIKLKLAPVHDKVWVGEHYIRFKLSGVENGETVEAHYTLSIEVAPKVITKLDVTVTDPETEPDEVTGTTEDGTVNNKDKDDKENIPIKDVTVTWGPEENKPDGKNTEVKVTVEIDPNYVYAEEDEDTPEKEDITENTEMTVTGKLTPDPVVIRDPEDGDHIVHITQKIPYLMHDDDKADGSDPKGPAINHSRTVTVAPSTTAEQLGKYTINLGAYGGNVYDVEWTVADLETSKLIGTGEDSLGATLSTLPEDRFDLTGNGAKQSVELDLTTITGKLTAGASYSFTLKAIGKANDVDDETEEPSIISLYTFTLRVSNPPTPGGGGSVEPCPCKVLYHIGLHGTTTDATIEDVSENNRPVKVPAVTALDGYVFRGWSLSNPATLKKGEKPVLVDPKTVDVKGESMIFYAVIVERPFHEHYVIGYPNGNFGPADDIDRASVATIIARAILPDFKEGANYGNPGKYTDVSGHWAESAIAYCSKYGVFEGYTDGTFKPNQPITRQEFALVIARLDGVMTPGEMDFTDIDEAGPWALGGIYTAYEKGWVNGYTDGTFKPLNNIRRDEAVKVFNAYLNRGVDADGLAKLHEYVHSGVASNVTGNGTDEYMTWPDVPQDHWAYYEIVEAANDHEYEPDFESELGYTLPETWDKCWIDERWRYHDDINDGGPNAALVSAGFRVWLH